MVLPHVAVLHVDFQNGRQPAAVARRKPALGDAHVLDRIRVEHAEKPKQVVHAVQRHAIEEHEVLVRGATANVEAARAFAPALDARQQLERLEQVDFAADGREGFDLVNGDLHFGHLHLLFDAVFLFARHHRLAQC